MTSFQLSQPPPKKFHTSSLAEVRRPWESEVGGSSAGATWSESGER